MNRLLVVAVLASAALSPAPAAAAGRDPVGEVTARAAERGVDGEAVVGPVREAERRGLPAGPVADKVLEGLAKGVAPERIEAVAAALVGRLEEADRLLAAASAQGLVPARDRGGAIQDLAHALGAGVDAAAVEALVTAARGAEGRTDAVVASAATMGALARRGVPVAEALPLGRALARAPGSAGEVVPAFDAWRARGGGDVHGFLAEAERRITERRHLAEPERDRAEERARERHEERARERQEERGRMRAGEPTGGHDRR